MWYVFHGDEEFTKAEAVAELKARVQADGMGALNTTVLDGDDLSAEELTNACSTVPFLTDRRLIVVEGLLTRLDKGGEDAKSYIDRLTEYLPKMPETTRLLFLEPQSLKKGHPILKLAAKVGKKGAYVREFELLDASRPAGQHKLQAWIRQRTKSKGTEIEANAVTLLIRYVGNNLRLLDQELEKLTAYANYERPITPGDVRQMVLAALEPDIFGLVDVLALRQGPEALQHLHELLADDQNPLYILTMIARQVRLVLATKDTMERRGRNRKVIGKEIGVSYDFIVKKLVRQAQLFSLEELHKILGLVLQLDQAIKTGHIEPTLGLELLILQVCGAPQSAHQSSSRARSS